MPIDPKFLISLNGREYPLYAGILAEAHARGITSILTELVQVPSDENGQTAIVFATVIMEGGKQTFQDYGDASPRNTNARIATALIRMASTRAKGRALRDAINCGQTMLEELPDLEEGAAPAGSRFATASPNEANGKGGEVLIPDGDGLVPCSHLGCASRIPRARAHHTTESYGAPFCAAHEALLEAAERGRREMAAREQTGPRDAAKIPPMVCSAEGCGKALTKGQYDVSLHRHGHAYCPAHQKALAAASVTVQA